MAYTYISDSGRFKLEVQSDDYSLLDGDHYFIISEPKDILINLLDCLLHSKGELPYKTPRVHHMSFSIDIPKYESGFSVHEYYYMSDSEESRDCLLYGESMETIHELVMLLVSPNLHIRSLLNNYLKEYPNLESNDIYWR